MSVIPSQSLRIYLVLLVAVLLGWLWWSEPALTDFIDSHWVELLGISAVYLCSHLLRMVRLVLLTLDSRSNAYSLVLAHALTALPCSFAPFKLGEVLRLAAFFRVFDERLKPMAVWLAERFGDVIVIILFIFGLYLFDIKISSGMRVIFIIFVLASVVSLLGLFAVAKIFVYLNRHLVLTSLTPRGLRVLRISHVLSSLETSILKSLEGRVVGFFLLSFLIWGFEILALYLFVSLLSGGELDFADFFTSGLLGGLPTNSQYVFGTYQSLALAVLALVFLLVAWLVAHFKRTRICHDRY